MIPHSTGFLYIDQCAMPTTYVKTCNNIINIIRTFSEKNQQLKFSSTKYLFVMTGNIYQQQQLKANLQKISQHTSPTPRAFYAILKCRTHIHTVTIKTIQNVNQTQQVSPVEIVIKLVRNISPNKQECLQQSWLIFLGIYCQIFSTCNCGD